MSEQDTFKPESLNIRDLFFNGNVTYTVPNYQRRYSWRQDQLDALWSDFFESFQNGHESSYFLGSVVVVKNKNNSFEIIDGQQRITTLFILMNVLLKTFPDMICVNPDNPDDDISTIDSSVLEKCIYLRKDKKRLTLQTAPEYDSIFNSKIIELDSYSSLSYPSKSELKKDNPEYNFRYAAKFFYDKFSSLEETVRQDLVFYILYNVKLIRIICDNFQFAIKLFQVMNDRGMPLSSADIIKSYILGRIEKDEDHENLSSTFTSNWKSMEAIAYRHDLKTDDLMIFYEYYKLKSNPKRQVVDELKTIIENPDTNIKDIINELDTFSRSLDVILSMADPTIYSLLYLPWPAYIKTCLASAQQVNYGIKIIKVKGENKVDDTELKTLISLMRRYFYLAFISGKTLNQIKQTSFNLLSAIVDKKPIEEIKNILNDSIVKYKMVRGVYEVLKDPVYGEDFLKPLLISIEYEKRELINKAFIPINKELHIDHILPQAFFKNDDWNYVNKENAQKYMDTLGNLALLCYKKMKKLLTKGLNLNVISIKAKMKMDQLIIPELLVLKQLEK